jgi:hypothetical protein
MLGTIMPVSLRAQAPGGAAQPAREAVANTQIVVNGGQVTITYDLIGSAAPGTFSVSLAISEDDGLTYGLTPTTVSGDVGARVAPGIGKRIVWDAAKDTENLQLDRLRFRVTVSLTVSATPARGAANGPAISPPAETPRSSDSGATSGQPLTQPPAPVSRPKGGSHGKKWGGLLMLGGGAALAAFGAVGALRAVSEDPYYPTCVSNQTRLPQYDWACGDFRGVAPNQRLVGAGAGIAGVGLLVSIFGARGNAPSIEIQRVPAGMMISRRFVY